MNKKKILVTGSAGFIGMHLVINLINQGHCVFGLDSINSYYDINLKYDRLFNCGISKSSILDKKLIQSSIYENYFFIKLDLVNKDNLEDFFINNEFDIIIHLAAQAGVRYSIENPETYIQNNILGFYNILNCARKNKISHFIYASSSSVYGNSRDIPYNEKNHTNAPVSLYAASKKCNEILAHSYGEIYNLRTTGLRFFTVYGPWGRPDMAYYSFTEKILRDLPIDIFNQGKLLRDFTNIKDIIDGINLIILDKMEKDNLSKIYNIGAGKPTELMQFVEFLEKSIGKKSIKIFKEMQMGDVITTFADITELSKLGYKPKVKLLTGLQEFHKWYFSYKNKFHEDSNSNS